MGEELVQKKIYHFKCDNEGKFLKTQCYEKGEKWRWFLILSNRKYNGSQSHYLAVTISTSDRQRFGYSLIAEDILNYSQILSIKPEFEKSKVLIDKVCRLNCKHRNNNEAFQKLPRIKLTDKGYAKITNKIKQFIDSEDGLIHMDNA